MIFVVVPVYFDVESFSILRQQIKKHLDARHELFFLVIDDSAGCDGRISAVTAADTEVLTTPYNLGHQKAIVYGLRYLQQKKLARQDCVVTMDADGEDRVEDLENLIHALTNLKSPAHSAVIASRTKRKEKIWFKLMYFCYKIIFRLLTGTVIRSGNYAALSQSFLQRYIFHPYFDFSYSASLIALIKEPLFIPCPRGTRYVGLSKMRPASLIRHGIEMFMPFLDRVATRCLIGLALVFGMSSLASVVVISVRIFTNLAIPGWATYTVLALGTISFISIGNFLLLFSVFAQSQSKILQRLANIHEFTRTPS